MSTLFPTGTRIPSRGLSHILLILALLCAAPSYAEKNTALDDSLEIKFYQDVRSALGDYKLVYSNLAQYYVDRIDPKAAAEASIRGLMTELDPYSNYFIEEEAQNIEDMSKGKYGGLGFEVGTRGREKRITVISPFEDTPAWEAGFQAGDIIDQVDGKSTLGKNLKEVITWIKGEAGTNVRLTLLRPGHDDPLDFDLTRALITIHDVRFSDIVHEKGHIGYIRLTRFSGMASENLRAAIKELQDRGMTKMILDLRSNPGGLLREAGRIADIFLPKNKLVVTTRGRNARPIKAVGTQGAPLFEGEVVVLINKGSASASEIVAGALQDYDRAVLLGDTTFGKGLVQSVININETAKLKMTTARYYLPSGRLIQRQDHFTDNKVLMTQHDSTKSDTLFKTAGGRLVKGGGGVTPDIELPVKRVAWVIAELWRQGAFVDFVADGWPGISDLEPSSKALFKDFSTWLDSSDFEFKARGTKQLDDLTKLMEEEEVDKGAMRALEKLREELLGSLEQQLKQHQDEILNRITLEMASREGGTPARTRLQLKQDEQYKAALELLLETDCVGYYELLSAP